MPKNVPPSLPASDAGRIVNLIEQSVQHVYPSSSSRDDSLLDLATFIVLEDQVASISLIQRRLKLGYEQACGLMEAMEQSGVVSRTIGADGIRNVLLKGDRRTELLKKLRGKAFQFGIGRDPDRIARVLEAIRLTWEKTPEMRLGQLVVLAVNPPGPCPEIFQIEDEELAAAITRTTAD